MPTPTRVHKPMPLRGLRSSWPGDTIGDSFSPNCLNVRFRFGEVRATPGRSLLTGSVNEKPLYIGQFPLLNGDIWVVMLTLTKMFRWGNGSPGTPRQWHEVQPGGTVPTGVGRWTAAVGEGKFFFARGDDPIFYWNGVSTGPFYAIVDNVEAKLQGTPPRAKYIEYFNNRLVGMYTTEGSDTFSNRVRWPESANFWHWDSTLGLGAGFMDLTDPVEPIRGGRALGDRLVVYTRRSIKEVIGTGTLDPVHVSQTRVRGIGCDAPYTIASTGQEQLFLGYDRNMYAWNGVNLIATGEPINEELRNITYPDKMGNYFATTASQRQEVWLVLDTGDAFVWDYARQAWSRDTVPAITALGEVDDTTLGLTWLDMTWPWEVEGRTWDQLRGISLTALFGGRSDGSTLVIDESVGYDYFSIGSILDRFVETPDFYLSQSPDKLATIYRLMMVYEFINDRPFEVGLSLDRGKTWQTKEVTPDRQGFSWIDWIATGNTVRFRFREKNDIGAFRWRSYVLEWIAAGDYTGSI